MNFIDLMREFRACPQGFRWASKSNHETIEQAWSACRRGDWMAWYAAKRGMTTELISALDECRGDAVVIAGDISVEAANIVEAIATKTPGKYAEEMLRCSCVIRKHIPLAP